jgi:signal transduction histidine kinase
MAGWLVIMSAVTFVTRRLAVRSMARLQADISDPQAARGGELSAVSKLVLDPVSKALLTSLQQVVGNQKKRERDVASRLHHTERLASFGQLAAGLAHEIKNPVAGIQGVLEILRDEATDETQRDLFERLIGETRRINETVQELLHFARPGEPRKVATDVAELLEDAVRLLTAGFARRGISVGCWTDPGLPPCSLDPAQIRQVLVNLVNNAGEAIESGGSIEIRATEIPDGGGVILAVADDGPGIPRDQLERIFEPFHTTKVHGTGLGLAVARTLVAQHGGTIEVDSRVGRGSTFVVILPGGTGAETGENRHNG